MRLLLCVCLVLSCPICAFASLSDEVPTSAKTFGSSAISGISSALSRSDVALCKSMIYPKHLKGDYGEAIVGKFYLEGHLQKSGQWRAVSSRFGRQGIDQLYIKYDRGRRAGIMVGEVKTDSSKLIMTEDGVQLGNRWTQKRLIALGNRYLNAGSAKNIKFQKRPSRLNVRHQIEVDIGKGRKAVFWREDGRRAWKYEGSRKHFQKAQNEVRLDGEYIKKAGQDIVKVRRRVFQVKIEKNHLNITVKNAKGIKSASDLSKIKGKALPPIKLSGESGRLSMKALSEEIARAVKQKIPHLSDRESLDYGKNIAKEIKTPKNTQHSYGKSVLSNSLKAGAVGAVFAVGFEVLSQSLSGSLSYQRLFETAAIGLGAVGTGTAVGQIATASMIRSSVANATLARTASSLGISTSFLGNTIGASVGGVVTSAIFAYAGYFMGYYDLYVANISALGGVAGAGGSAMTGLGIMGLVSAYGTASTGAAISSLSGAAATKASLALLGGGTLASGGGGAALGAFVLGGAVFIVGASVAVATAYAFSLYEEKEEKEMLKLMLDEYAKGDIFRHQADRLFPTSAQVASSYY